jgi:hypothetical protein
MIGLSLEGTDFTAWKRLSGIRVGESQKHWGVTKKTHAETEANR